MLSPLLTQRQAASVLSISVRSLERMRVSGGGPVDIARLNAPPQKQSLMTLSHWRRKRTLPYGAQEAC